MSSLSSVRKISEDLARNHLSDVDEVGEDFSTPFFGPGKWIWDRKLSSGSVLSDSSRRSSQDEQRKKKSSDGSLHAYLDYLGERRRSSDASVILNGDTDSFIIGDRVWVGGTKPGQIAYIGETQFAPGDWAGVVLDEAIGKNDGSVANIRYFQCEPKKGVFSRLTRLTRYPILEAPSVEPSVPSTGYAALEAREARRSTGSLSATPSKKSSVTSHTPSPKTSFSKPASPDSALHPNITIGDRVIVMSAQGSKAGVLQFMGPTDFAPGEWCGVELDDPLGKNDGSVAGTRYFECRPKFGLFAPVHKVSKSPSGRRPSQANCQIHRRGSKESLVSVTSSIASTRSAAPRKVAARVPTTPTSTKNSLQDQLRDKDQHIEQLLRERELERAEVTRAASQADEAERRLVEAQREWEAMREEADSRLRQALAALDSLKSMNDELTIELEEERAKSEDLQFRFEEARIEKESLTAESADKLRVLEESLDLEKSRAAEEEQNRLFELEEQLINAKVELSTLQEQLQSAKAVNESLEAEKSSLLKSATDDERTTVVRYEAAIKEEREKAKTAETVLQSNLENARENITKLNQQLQKTLIDSKENEMQLKQQLETVVKTAQLATKELEERLSRELEVEKERGKKLEESFKADLEKERQNGETEIQRLNAALSEVVANSKETEEKLKKKLVEMQKEVSDRQQQLEMSAGSAGKQVAELNDSLTKLKTQLSETREQGEHALKQLNESKLIVTELSAKLMENEKALTDLRKLNDDLNKKSQLDVKTFSNQIEELKAGLISKEAELKSSLEVSQDLNNKLDAETKGRNLLAEELDGLKLDVSDLSRKLDCSQEKLKVIQEQKAQVDEQLAAYASSSNDVNAQLQIKQAEVAKKESEAVELSTELSKSKLRTQQLEQEVEQLLEKGRQTEKELGGQVDNLKLDVSDLNNKLLGEYEKLKTLQEQKSKVETELAAFMNSSTDANTQLQAKHSELVQKEKELEELRGEHLVAKQQCQRFEQELGQLKEKSQVNEDTLSAQLEASKTNIGELNKKYEEVEEKLKILQEQKSKVDMELAGYISSSADVNTQLQIKLSELQSKEKDIEDLRNKQETSKQLNHRLEEELQQLKQKSKTTEENQAKNMDNLKASINELTTKLQGAEEKGKVLKDEKAMLEEELLLLKSSSTDANTQLQAKLNDIQQKERELIELKNSHIESRNECERLEKELEQVRSETKASESALQEKINDLENASSKTIQQLKKELLENKQELETSTQSLLQSQSEAKKNEEAFRAKIEELVQSGKIEKNNLETSLQNENEKIAKRLAEETVEKEALVQQLEVLTKVSNEKEKALHEREQLLDTVQTNVEDINRRLAENENTLAMERSITKTLNDEKLKLTQTISEKIYQLELKETEINKLTALVEDLEKSTSEWKSKFEKLTEASGRSESESHRKATNLEQELESTKADLAKYKAGYGKMETFEVEVTEKLRVADKEKTDLSLKVKALQDLNEGLTAAKVNYELERESLEKQLEYGNVLMTEKEKEITKMAEEIEALQAERNAQEAMRELLQGTNTLLQQRDSECETLRKEKIHLVEQVNSYKSELVEKNKDQTNTTRIESNANITRDADVVPQDEQVEFLNSVIVDMQLKNEALKARIQALEIGDSPDDYTDYDLLNITTRTVAPRLFCDICDRFDLHDTEDCPTQAMEDDDMPARVPNKTKAPPPQRPYCESCEVFGHDTADCDDAETF